MGYVNADLGSSADRRRGKLSSVLLLPGNDLGPWFYAPLGVPVRERPWRATWEESIAAIEVPEVLIGHSLGGLLAILIAARRPPALRRLILLEPAAPPWQWLARAAAKRYTREVVERATFVNTPTGLRRIHDPASYPPALIAQYLAHKSDAAKPLIQALPSLYPLPIDRITVPITCVRGASSGLVSRLAARQFAETIVLPRAGHWLLHEGHDDRILEIIRGTR